MRIYLASRYKTHENLNSLIRDELERAGFETFLPISINIDAVTADEKKRVCDLCYDNIETADCVVAVAPYGRSVSAELSYAYALQKFQSKPRYQLVLFSNMDPEAMIGPTVDYYCDSIEMLIERLKDIEKRIHDAG